MSPTQSPIESEFASPEEAEAYARWLRDKVERSIAEASPAVAHDDAIAHARAVMAARRKKKTVSTK